MLSKGMLIGVLLVMNGLLKSFKFGEAYLPTYLSTYKDIPLQDVYDRVFPVWTYSYLVFLVPVSLLAESIGGYRTLVWLEACMDAATYGVLFWGQGLRWMQGMQVMYGLATAASVGYVASVTALYSAEQTSRWNGILRATLLIGHVLGSLASQLALYLGLPMPWLYLATFVALLLGLLVSLFFPKSLQTVIVKSVDGSDKVDPANERGNQHETIGTIDDPFERDCAYESIKVDGGKTGRNVLLGQPLGYCEDEPLSRSLRSKAMLCWRDFVCRFRRTFCSVELVLLSLYWSLLFASLNLSEGYVASVWSEHAFMHADADGNGEGLAGHMNGVMDAMGRIIGAVGSLLGGYVRLPPSDDPKRRQNVVSVTMVFLTLLFGSSVSVIGLYAHAATLWISASAYCVMMGSGYALTSYVTGWTALMLTQGQQDHPFLLGAQMICSMLFQTILIACTDGLALVPRFQWFAAINVLTIGALVGFFLYRTFHAASSP